MSVIPKKELERRHKQFAGKNNPKYVDGKSKERMYGYMLELSRSNWRRIKKVVLERDGYVCMQCGKVNRLSTVHHIISYRNGGTHDLNNLVVLCRSCHCKIERHGEECKF